MHAENPSKLCNTPNSMSERRITDSSEFLTTFTDKLPLFVLKFIEANIYHTTSTTGEHKRVKFVVFYCLLNRIITFQEFSQVPKGNNTKSRRIRLLNQTNQNDNLAEYLRIVQTYYIWDVVLGFTG
jgi:hypothetical protein